MLPRHKKARSDIKSAEKKLKDARAKHTKAKQALAKAQQGVAGAKARLAAAQELGVVNQSLDASHSENNMPSKRTLNSKSPLDTAESRKILASIKRGLRRVKRDLQALQPVASLQPEQPIHWDAEQYSAQVNSISVSNWERRNGHARNADAL